MLLLFSWGFLWKSFAALSLLIVALSLVLRAVLSAKRPKQKTIAFFHPYCNDGGGGERVLWLMIATIRQQYPEYKCVVFSGDRNVSGADILHKVKNTFGVELSTNDVSFCFLESRQWLEASRYPVFTMIGQSLGATIVVIEALTKCSPHVFFDSMGYSFTYWICRIFGGCKVACYTHYPTISTDMLSRVQSGHIAHNNQHGANSIFKKGKLFYYQLFALLYGLAGKGSQLVLVNSSWTKGHINRLWKVPARTHTLYPPCNTTYLSTLPLNNRDRNVIVSIAQFRPEKDHALQIRAIAQLLNTHPDNQQIQSCKLVLIGSCRNQGDEQRIASLKQLAQTLNVADHIQFEINVPFEQLKKWYSTAQYGIHTMWCEHFGIGVVELMASGVVVVAHNSGGPKADIVVPLRGQSTGRLASSENEYAEKLAELLLLSDEAILDIQRAAREHADIFSDEKFKEHFAKHIKLILE